MFKKAMMLPQLFFLVLSLLAGVSDAKKWQTLSGEAPRVVARGGYSGIFPEHTPLAYLYADSTSMPGVVLLCDLQLTKDGVGICSPDLRLDNSTNVANLLPGADRTYEVNGVPLRGWFAVDLTSDQIFSKIRVRRNVLSRPEIFDGQYSITTLDYVKDLRPYALWLNIPSDAFYGEHGLDMAAYVENTTSRMPVGYISSSEIGFLKKMTTKVGRGGKTKLILRFLGEEDEEPTTRQPFKSLLGDLLALRPFCRGILVPKTYIWPVNEAGYLGQPTDLVLRAHRLGLEVFAYSFANDMPGSYNYSYNPTAEYLQFVGGPDFAVDGVISDFPSTASEAIACFIQEETISRGKGLVISLNGASGDFAGCTDLAYQKAVEDRADVIDCSVQMTSDGIAFCLGSPDLTSSTTAATTFLARSTLIPEIQPNSGIFSFDLTWEEVQSLQPELKSPLQNATLPRNPAMENAGRFLTLPDFLDFSKTTRVQGVLVDIQNAAFLAAKKGLDVVGQVGAALANSSFPKQVMIQSDDSSVLAGFRDSSPSYKRVLLIKETVRDAPPPAVEAIKRVAHAVNLPRFSVVSSAGGFVASSTSVVAEMRAADLSVFVSVLRNEFMTVPLDFFADPIVEIASYFSQFGADAVVTEFPATAASYLRSPCYNYTAVDGYAITPLQVGSLLKLARLGAEKPTMAPAPTLTVADVVDPPLPPVSHAEGASPGLPSGQLPDATSRTWLLLAAMASAAAFVRIH